MLYNIPKKDEQDILNDSIEKEGLNILEDLLGRKLNVKIENQSDLLNLIDNPQLYLEDEKIIEEIKNLKELIVEMSDLYNV